MSIKPRIIFGDEDEMSPQLKTAFENLNKFNESIAKLKPVFRKMGGEVLKAPDNVARPLSEVFKEQNKTARAEIENLGKLAPGLDKAFADENEALLKKSLALAEATKTTANHARNSLQKVLSIEPVNRKVVEQMQEIIALCDEAAKMEKYTVNKATANSRQIKFRDSVKTLRRRREMLDFYMLLRNLGDLGRTIFWNSRTGSLNRPKLSWVNLSKNFVRN